MIKRYPYDGLTWIDVQSPSREEIRSLMEEHGIHPSAVEELLLPTHKPRVQSYGDFVYATFHFPAWKHSHTDTVQEIDIVLGKKVVITNHYEDIDALHKFGRVFEVNSTLEKEFPGADHAGIIFYHILRELYISLSDELDFMRDALADIEKNTFSGREKEMVFALSKVSRELLSFKHAIAAHKETLESIRIFALRLFGDAYEGFIRSILVEYSKIEKTVAGHMESLVELRETNNSLLETKQNRIVQSLTVITFITSIIAIMSALLQIDTVSRPIIGMENDFWIIVGGALLISGIMLAVFKWKKWL